jgi:hypothetical protein
MVLLIVRGRACESTDLLIEIDTSGGVRLLEVRVYIGRYPFVRHAGFP